METHTDPKYPGKLNGFGWSGLVFLVGSGVGSDELFRYVGFCSPLALAGEMGLGTKTQSRPWVEYIGEKSVYVYIYII